MGRDIRFIPPDSLQHVVDVVVQNRWLLRPSRRLNERFLGVLGRAQRLYGMTVCAVVVMSNHYHLLLRPRDGAHLAAFMCFLKTNLSKEIGGKLRGWRGPFFEGRYRSTTVSSEESSQVRVLRYLLSNGTKEGLVDCVQDWPGVHCADALMSGAALEGFWFDRTASHASIDPKVAPECLTSREEVVFSPIPCWQHLPEEHLRQAVADLVSEIDQAAAADRQTHGKSSLGKHQILQHDPYHRPESVDRSPKPRFHASSRRALHTMMVAWREIVRAFEEASQALRSGQRSVRFPEGTFPPSLPFVPSTHPAAWARGHPF